jgi:hypothetical protein
METLLNSKVTFVTKAIVFVIFLMALWLAVRRNTYLTFLAPTVFPYSLVKDAKDFGSTKGDHNVHTTIKVDAPDGTKVVYWGALPSTGVQPTPQIAYDDYSNAGVALVSGGAVQVSFFCPAKYRIPWGKVLDRHVHYRIINKDGMISSVRTQFVKC